MRESRRSGPGALGFVPPWLALAAVGTGFLVVAVGNFWLEITTLGFRLAPIVAAAMTVSLSAAVVYAAVLVRAEGLDDRDAWTVVGAGLGGGTLAMTAQGMTVLVRLAEGRPLAEPQFPLLIVGNIGVIGGVVVGNQYVRARQAAREAAQARDAMGFTNSLLRHDVLNGLQVIEGNAGLLAEHGDESVRERAGAIQGQVDSLTSLVDEVRSVSAVLTGDVDPEAVDLRGLLAETAGSARRSHDGVTVETDLPTDLTVRGSDALRPVFSNLLANAVQHGGSGVRVRVSATREKDSVTVRVADDGPGIPPERRERVFERGTGTGDGGKGLYVADTIVDRLGGEIRVGESEWGGAEFVVTLPAAGGE